MTLTRPLNYKSSSIKKKNNLQAKIIQNINYWSFQIKKDWPYTSFKWDTRVGWVTEAEIVKS